MFAGLLFGQSRPAAGRAGTAEIDLWQNKTSCFNSINDQSCSHVRHTSIPKRRRWGVHYLRNKGSNAKRLSNISWIIQWHQTVHLYFNAWEKKADSHSITVSLWPIWEIKHCSTWEKVNRRATSRLRGRSYRGTIACFRCYIAICVIWTFVQNQYKCCHHPRGGRIGVENLSQDTLQVH